MNRVSLFPSIAIFAIVAIALEGCDSTIELTVTTETTDCIAVGTEGAWDDSGSQSEWESVNDSESSTTWDTWVDESDSDVSTDSRWDSLTYDGSDTASDTEESTDTDGPRCGNGRVEPGEECDYDVGCDETPDGSCCSAYPSGQCRTVSGDGCSSDCLIEECGNGRVEGLEECDVAIVYTAQDCLDCRWVYPCEECEEKSCSNFQGIDVVSECEDAHGFALEGPAAGEPISELCLEFVKCAQETGCAQANGDIEGCYCGDDIDIIECKAEGGNGPCMSEAQAAAESFAPQTIAERWSDPDYAIGLAQAWLSCDASECPYCLWPAECGNYRVDEPDEECDDGNTDNNDGCDSNCLVEECGNGRIEAGEECDPAIPSIAELCHSQGEAACTWTVACDYCAADHCADAGGRDLFGECYDAPAPEDDLCADVMECAHETLCAVNDPLACYCGDFNTQIAYCRVPGVARGMCKTECEQAASTSDPENITKQYEGSEEGVLARAMRLLQCEREHCPMCNGSFETSSSPDTDSDTSMDTGTENGTDDHTSDDTDENTHDNTEDFTDDDTDSTTETASSTGLDTDEGSGDETSWETDSSFDTQESCQPCAVCQAEHCESYYGEDAVAACEDPSNDGLCAAAVACARDEACVDVHPRDCFCGTASDLMCMAGKADGPCLEEFQAAARSTNPLSIAERFMDPLSPLGDATSLLLCYLDYCPACLDSSIGCEDTGYGGTDSTAVIDTASDTEMDTGDTASDTASDTETDTSDTASDTVSETETDTSDTATESESATEIQQDTGSTIAIDTDSQSQTGIDTETESENDTGTGTSEPGECSDPICPNGKIVGGDYADYATLSAAIADIASNGLSDCQVLCLSDGVYEEQVAIPAISGASASRQLIIKSQSGNPESVVIVNGASETDADWVVELAGADYVTVRDVTLRSFGASYATVLRLRDDAWSNTFEGNIFQTVSASNPRLVDVSDPNKGNTFVNNKFEGGGTGLRVWSAKWGVSNLSVMDNVFEDQVNVGIEVQRGQQVTIAYNRISSNRQNAAFNGILLSNCWDRWIIEGNEIVIPAGKGMCIRYASGTPQSRNTVANNFVRVQGAVGASTAGAAVELVNTTEISFYYNTLVIGETANVSAVALNVPSESGTVTGTVHAANNILVNLGAKAVVNLELTEALTDCDYNDLYTTGSTLGTYGADKKAAADLSAWRTALSIDAHSLDVDPEFRESDDYTLCSAALDGAGKPTAHVTTDIEGAVRDSTNPDLGVVEFSHLEPGCI